MNLKQDIKNLEDIKLLVNTFYQQVLKDENIGFFFTEIEPISLTTHMPIMYSFWNSVLFYTGEYKGNPMQKHLALSKKQHLNKEHFETWLTLWKKTVTDLFEGKKADEAIAKAEQIASMMNYETSKNH